MSVFEELSSSLKDLIEPDFRHNPHFISLVYVMFIKFILLESLKLEQKDKMRPFLIQRILMH